jgi:hypothetical protein
MPESDHLTVESDLSPRLNARNRAFFRVEADEADATVDFGSAWVIVGNKQADR